MAREREQVAAIHAKVGNTRLYHAQQAAFKLVRGWQTICVEDLNVAGMVKNKRLARHISDAGFSIFNRELAWLSTKYNRDLVRIDRFYPSSKRCSACGEINRELSLDDRVWQCKSCQSHLTRDDNAAQNILQEGLTGAGKLRVNDAEGAETEPQGRVERPLNRQGRKAKNCAYEREVKETCHVE